MAQGRGRKRTQRLSLGPARSALGHPARSAFVILRAPNYARPTRHPARSAFVILRAPNCARPTRHPARSRRIQSSSLGEDRVPRFCDYGYACAQNDEGRVADSRERARVRPAWMLADHPRGAIGSAPGVNAGVLLPGRERSGPMVRRFSHTFEERVASRDQRRAFSHHMQPVALRSPPHGTPGGGVAGASSPVRWHPGRKSPAITARCASTHLLSSCA